jgi:hypothetical protein
MARTIAGQIEYDIAMAMRYSRQKRDTAWDGMTNFKSGKH